MIGVALFGGMLVFMLLGIPIVFSLGLAAVLATFLIGPTIPWIIIPSSMMNGMNSFPLMAVPFFILAGELMSRGGIAERLVDFANALVGHIRGGLGHATVVSNTMLALDTGSALAQIAAVGRIMIPAMERHGYPRDFATALTCCASLIGPIIPPSITMVIYAVTAGASVAGLFLAGVVPGLLFAGGLMAYVYLRALVRGERPEQKFSLAEVARTRPARHLRAADAAHHPRRHLRRHHDARPNRPPSPCSMRCWSAPSCSAVSPGATFTRACSTPGSPPASSC